MSGKRSRINDGEGNQQEEKRLKMDTGPDSGETPEHLQMAELPKELWTLVLERLEEVQDFAQALLVSKTFYAIILNICWSKVERIGFGRGSAEINGEMFIMVDIHTGIHWQNRWLPINQAALLLERLCQKVSKTTSLDLDFIWVVEEKYDKVFCHVLDALVTAQIKFQELTLRALNPPSSFSPTTPHALARFLKANAQSLTTLNVTQCFSNAAVVPAELLEAFQTCLSLQHAKVSHAESLVGSILLGKPHLKSLELDNTPETDASAVLGSGASLCWLKATTGVLQEYAKKVGKVNDHPLRTVKKLDLPDLSKDEVSSFPWALLPSLELLPIKNDLVSQAMVNLVCSFLMHWAAGGEAKTLECQLGVTGYRWDVGMIAKAAVASGVTQTWDSLMFRKRNAAIKIRLL